MNNNLADRIANILAPSISAEMKRRVIHQRDD
jgi:hypothetical protein